MPEDQDRIGPALESALPAARRHHHGQHFTRADVADLISALCIRSANDRVLDPSCGAGGMLLRARARLRRLGAPRERVSTQLVGVELDSAIAGAARENLPDARILTGDFLGSEPLARGVEPPRCPEPFDAIIGNPPYVRQELIGPARKEALAGLLPFRLSRRADLHVMFWPRAMTLLRDGGRLGFLTSNTWLDAEYGGPLRRWLGAEFAIVAVIESEVESWFDDARVRTLITIVQKSDPAVSAPTRMVRLTARLDQIVPPDLDQEERLARFETLAHEIERGAAGHGRFTRGREATPRALAKHSWGAMLRLPDVYFEIVAHAGDRLKPLAELADVSWGIKTGDDTVFFVAADRPPPVEPEFLTPVVFNLMELDRIVVTLDQLGRRLLHVDLRNAHRSWPQDAPRLSRYLEMACRERGSHLRPTCHAREKDGTSPRRWFELRPGLPGAILWSIMHQYRHLAPLNPQGFPANDNLLLIRPREGVNPRLLAALLNSHVQALIKQAFGRHRNEGMLKMQTVDVRRMLVPDPRLIDDAHTRRLQLAFDAIASRRVGRIPKECRQPDRRALDETVAELLGFENETPALTGRIHAALIDACERERTWELDAVSKRRRPASTVTRPLLATLQQASAPAD